MKNQYNIILGLALLTFIASSYVFKNTRYFSATTGEEVKIEQYDKGKDEFNYLLREKYHLNYEAGFITGVITMGAGLLFVGLFNRKKIE